MQEQYIRQTQFFNPETHGEKYTLNIIGTGSLGSFLTLTLAKLGFKRIRIYDYDTIELHNLPNQFYRTQDIGTPKTQALKEIVHQFTGLHIQTYGKIDSRTKIPTEPEDIYIYCLDSFQARRTITKKLAGKDNWLIDIRMGGLNNSTYILKLNDKERIKQYLESIKGNGSEQPCGARSIIYTILNATSTAAKMITDLTTEKPTNILSTYTNMESMQTIKEETTWKRQST